MSIPYRTQQNIKHLFIGLLILGVVGVFVCGLWFLAAAVCGLHP